MTTMTAQILDGRAIAKRLKEGLAAQVRALIQRAKVKPCLASLHVGDDAPSRMFVRAQQTHATELGIDYRPISLPANASQQQVEQRIQQLNQDRGVHGIFVQNPMPAAIDPQRVSAVIDPLKDVEGIHPQNSARRFFGKSRIGSCTALAVMELIESTRVNLRGKEAVVVGHSEIVGRPVGMLLLDQMATTTICHAATNERGQLQQHVERAEVLVVAVGQPKLIKGAWIKPGAIVIDVGINVRDHHVTGDVEFDEAAKRAGFITPVPGGVGPVTVIMVMKNAIEAFKLQVMS